MLHTIAKNRTHAGSIRCNNKEVELYNFFLIISWRKKPMRPFHVFFIPWDECRFIFFILVYMANFTLSSPEVIYMNIYQTHINTHIHTYIYVYVVKCITFATTHTTDKHIREIYKARHYAKVSIQSHCNTHITQYVIVSNTLLWILYH